MGTTRPPLQLSRSQKLSSIINRLYSLIHSIALLLHFHYRISSIQHHSTLHLLILSSELILSLIWLLYQAFLCSPVSRTIFPDRLPEDKQLPAIDVFICTADPKKEPPIEVMNTVLSAMALDYPSNKLHVYLSDDGYSPTTLLAMREAFVFSKHWLPFCLKFGVKCRCPKAFFSNCKDYRVPDQEIKRIKRMYELLEERIKRAEVENGFIDCSDNHPSVVQVIDIEDSTATSPRLVYVSREKRSSYPHHAKAGALNVLLRVSSVISNSPYVLVLDCDMYCYDPSSARQAMCFHLDRQICSTLAFVQFPQKFHLVTESDIYDSHLRAAFKIRCAGMDGLQGPTLGGTGFYIKRQALCRNVHNIMDKGIKPTTLQQLTSCDYEQHTLWGKQIGFLYNSMVEDVFTSFMLHCKGWKSVFFDPSRPAFLGTPTTKLQDTLVQGTRWNCGLFELTTSKFSPLIYGLFQNKMSVLQTMGYGYYSLLPLYSVPVWCLATLPQLCLLNGIQIYPKVSSSWFGVIASIFILSQSKQLVEVLTTGGSVLAWWNEQRIWMIKSVTAYTYGILDTILKHCGVRQPSFLPTDKVADDEQMKLYQKGMFNFHMSSKFLTPLVTLVIWNVISFIGGITRMLIHMNWEEMMGQFLLSFYIILVNYPIIEGMALRKDEASIPSPTVMLSLVFCLAFFCFGSVLLRFDLS